MHPEPPPGQGPVDPQGAFSPPNPPSGGGWDLPAHGVGPAPQGTPVQQGAPPQGPQGPMGPGRPPMGPPMMPPPGMGQMMPMMYPPPPPKKSVLSGFARMVFTTLASLILLGSIAMNVYLLAYVAATAGSDIETQTLVEGSAKQSIAVIPVKGMILDGSVETFEKMIQMAEKDAKIKAVVIEIDTPGGSVTASDEIYHRIVRFKAETGKPVVASMQSLATSGGYYIACAADYVVAQQSTMTGNIGVMMPRFDLSKFAQEHGIEDNSLHSTGSDFKTAGSMWKAETPEERAYIQGLIDTAFGQFKAVVVAGRGAKLDPDSQETVEQKVDRIANGKVYMAPEALRLGLIDAIGYRHDALGYVASTHGLSGAKVIRYEKPEGLFSSLGANLGLGTNESSGGVNVRVDARLIEEITRPRLMYMGRMN